MSLRRRPLHGQDETSQEDFNADNGVKSESTINAEKPNKEKSPKATATDQASPPSNPLEWLAIFYHLAISVFYALLLYHGNKVIHEGLHLIDPDGVIPAYGGRFKFLTHINQWFQLGYFTLQFMTDILPNSSVKKNLQKVCDVFFTSIAVPFALFVTVTFWAIYAIDRRLVYPERFDLVVPQYLNHFWHTTIALWVFFETLVCFHRYPSTGVAASVNFVFNAVYLGWIVWIFVKTDFWVYGILKVLPPHFMALFFAGCMFLGLAFYFVGKAIAHLRWGQTLYIE